MSYLQHREYSLLPKTFGSVSFQLLVSLLSEELRNSVHPGEPGGLKY